MCSTLRVIETRVEFVVCVMSLAKKADCDSYCYVCCYIVTLSHVILQCTHIRGIVLCCAIHILIK